MSVETLYRAGGDDGSGRDSDWRVWSASVDGTREAVADRARNVRLLGSSGVLGITDFVAEVLNPVQGIAELETRLFLGGMGISSTLFSPN